MVRKKSLHNKFSDLLFVANETLPIITSTNLFPFEKLWQRKWLILRLTKIMAKKVVDTKTDKNYGKESG